MASQLDHDDVPIEGAIKIHPDLCISWDPDTSRPDLQRLWVWHWCTRSVWHAKAEAVNYEGYNREYMRPTWRAAGVGAHTLVSTDPVHLEPSLYWPDCCGAHGFLRAGAWTPV